MQTGPIETYRPRAVSDHGIWDIGSVRYKAYGLLAEGQSLTDIHVAQARQFLSAEVAKAVVSMGDSNGLGFVIIHPGDLGVSISAQWWVQGSVLCQRIHRQLYGAHEPMDTVTRPVIGCVWELALINAEQEVWRRTMMRSVADAHAYLAARPDFSAA
ncbi:MAG: hypothetical protein AAFV62_02815 [Pseudomonadota bacterium]